MMPEDVAIWERFISAYPNSFELCMYDFPVGSLPEFMDTSHPVAVAGEEKLYKKKIDVVGLKGQEIAIIELKPKAGASAVGQVKMYCALFKKENPAAPACRAVVITDSVSSDVQEFAREEGVQFVVV